MSTSFSQALSGAVIIIIDPPPPLLPYPLRCIINLSMSSSFSQAFNDAVNGAYSQGVIVTVAAGNSAVDCSNLSPASASSAVTVGAVYQNATIAAFSNYGAAVDVFAPGAGIISLYAFDPKLAGIMSGTSQAAPHVAGAAALFWAQYPTKTAAGIVALLKTGGSNAVVYSNPTTQAGTTKTMLYTRL